MSALVQRNFVGIDVNDQRATPAASAAMRKCFASQTGGLVLWRDIFFSAAEPVLSGMI
jgi:hypothetical protein